MKCKLGDICTKIGSGATPRGGKDAYCDKGITLVRSQNVLDFSFSDSGLAFINEEQAAKLNNVEVLSGDVLLNITGDSVARACMMDDSFLPARVNQHVAIIRGKNDIVINRYLLYFLQWQKSHLLQLASGGATRNALTKGMIEQLEIELPSLEQQKTIVAILGSLDDKIALNNKINENLEQQAQTIFRKMFLEDTQRRKVTIRDVVANVTDGVHNTVKDDPEGHYFLLSCKNIKGGKITLGNSERKINEETFEKLRKRTRLEKGDVLLSSVGTIGELVLLKEDPFCYEFQRSVAMIKPNREIVSPEYLYEALLTQRLEIIHAAHGAVQQCVFISDIYDFIIPLPTQKELSKFDSMVVPMFDKIQQNEHEIRCLTNLRDALLLKLMNGELKAYLVR